MDDHFEMIRNTHQTSKETNLSRWNEAVAREVRSFHETLSGYKTTPLVPLAGQAEKLGISGLYVKDESSRFGLNAFKALGASFAMGTAAKDWMPGEKHTFVTATDGNHGRGVAWMARQMGQKAVVYLPEGTAKSRLHNILAEGADAYITDLNYDDAVRLAASKEKEEGWILVQDTAWDGYERIPELIMKGYLTMALEAYEELEASGTGRKTRPTHIFLQAGVGSMAAAVAAFFLNVYREQPPAIVIVEPKKADCFFRSIRKGERKPVAVTGKMDTMMAGLACGEPSALAWPILRDHAYAFISCDDCYAADGMRLLGKPLPGDKRIVSGESGAVSLGVLSALMTDPELSEDKEALKLNNESVVLCISTEGATDPEHYRAVVEKGKSN